MDVNGRQRTGMRMGMRMGVGMVGRQGMGRALARAGEHQRPSLSSTPFSSLSPIPSASGVVGGGSVISPSRLTTALAALTHPPPIPAPNSQSVVQSCIVGDGLGDVLDNGFGMAVVGAEETLNVARGALSGPCSWRGAVQEWYVTVGIGRERPYHSAVIIGGQCMSLTDNGLAPW